ncbi:hypothetical protein OT109_15165 [Phycisphaeraceae bacterium D3-23]
MQTPTHWQTILAGATRAPSPHNTQPWRVRVLDDRRAELYLDAARLIVADKTGCFQVSAAGIFIEAVRLLAANIGYRLEVELHEIELTSAMVPIAQMALEEDPQIEPTGIDAPRLAQRRTARLAHTGRLMSDREAEPFHGLAEAFGQHFGYSTENALIERTLARNTEAIFEDMDTRTYREEFVGWLRNKRQAAVKRDGMELGSMRMGVMEYQLLRAAPWLLKTPGIRGPLSRRYRRTLGQTDHIGWLSGPFWEYPQAIEAGRFLLRFWLALSELGMGMHPLGNLVTNARAKAWLDRELVGGPGAWLVFRFGQTPTPPKSGRLPLSEVLLD